MIIEDLQDCIYEKEEDTGICTLAFNRPERRNALTFISLLEIETVLTHMEEDKSAIVLIITGSKEGNAFTSGAYYSAKMLTSIKNLIEP
jgi:1,4-dihydroxy-2-naphthoyl-CoA synthase